MIFSKSPVIFAALSFFAVLVFSAEAQTPRLRQNGPLVPGAHALLPGQIRISVNYNSHQLFLTPELVRTGSGLIPWVPGPFSIGIRQNLLPVETPNVLEGIEYTTEVYVNGNNAPAVSADIGSAFRMDGLFPWFQALRVSIAGISSMETNAWLARTSANFGTNRFLISFAGEIGILLALPENLFFAGTGLSVNYLIIRELLIIHTEFRGSSIDRFSAGGSLSFLAGSFAFTGGGYFVKTPSGHRINPAVSITYSHRQVRSPRSSD
ncbi:MAG: hypothetical protein ACLFR1_02840 [Spirochaetia bacterium]